MDRSVDDECLLLTDSVIATEIIRTIIKWRLRHNLRKNKGSTKTTIAYCLIGFDICIKVYKAQNNKCNELWV